MNALSDPAFLLTKGGGVSNKIDERLSSMEKMLSDVNDNLDVGYSILDEDINKRYDEMVKTVTDDMDNIESMLKELSKKMEEQFDTKIKTIVEKESGVLSDYDIDRIVSELNIEEKLFPHLWNYLDGKFGNMPPEFTKKASNVVEGEKKKSHGNGGNVSQTQGKRRVHAEEDSTITNSNGQKESKSEKDKKKDEESQEGTLRKWLTSYADRNSKDDVGRSYKDKPGLENYVLTIGMILAMTAKSGLFDNFTDNIKDGIKAILPEGMVEKVDSLFQTVTNFIDNEWEELKKDVHYIYDLFVKNEEYAKLDSKEKQMQYAKEKGDVAMYAMASEEEIGTADAMQSADVNSGYRKMVEAGLIGEGEEGIKQVDEWKKQGIDTSHLFEAYGSFDDRDFIKSLGGETWVSDSDVKNGELTAELLVSRGITPDVFDLELNGANDIRNAVEESGLIEYLKKNYGLYIPITHVRWGNDDIQAIKAAYRKMYDDKEGKTKTITAEELYSRMSSATINDNTWYSKSDSDKDRKNIFSDNNFSSKEIIDYANSYDDDTVTANTGNVNGQPVTIVNLANTSYMIQQNGVISPYNPK